MDRCSRITRATCLALLGLLVAPAFAAPAQAQPGPQDLEPIRKLVVDTVMPLTDAVYDATACAYVGGFWTFKPPVVSEATGAGCDNPWCRGPVSFWCFQPDKLTQPEYAMCVTYQTVTPEHVVIPYQDAVSPLWLRCVNVLYHLSHVGGVCREVVELLCLRQTDYEPCYAYSSALGCVTVQSGPCTQAVQVACWGYVYSGGKPQYPAFCAVWIASQKYCLATTA